MRPLLLALTLVAAHAAAQDGSSDGGTTGPALADLPTDAGQSPPASAAPVPAPAPGPAAAVLSVLSKFNTSFSGFIELDAIADSTQSFTDVAGNAAIARGDTYAGNHGRLTLGVRNSRVAFKVAAPEFQGLRASATLEMDFLGNQPPNASEAAFFTNPSLRIRHAWLKVESPYVDVLFGQTWQLFGWQPYFLPNTVGIQGVPGQAYSRSPQLRLSHVFKTELVNVEVAAAASRAPQRDALVPDGEGGVRVLFNRWKGLRTMGATHTAVDSLALGVSGVVRRFDLPEFAAAPRQDTSVLGWGFSLDAMVPIIPATMDDRGNALTLTANFVRGEGISDLFTGLTGGVSFPALPNPTGAMPAPVYTPDVDTGPVVFTPDGVLHPVRWEAFVVGLQYALPPSGRFWVTANYSQLASRNAQDLGVPTRVFTFSRWFDANLFCEVTPAVRLGLEYAWFGQTYADGAQTQNHRAQLSAFYLF